MISPVLGMPNALTHPDPRQIFVCLEAHALTTKTRRSSIMDNLQDSVFRRVDENHPIAVRREKVHPLRENSNQPRNRWVRY